MARAEDARCLHCGGKIPLFRKLTSGQFCSKEHEKAYWKEQERLAIEVLHRTHDTLMAYQPPPGDIELIIGPPVEWDPALDQPLRPMAPAPEPVVETPAQYHSTIEIDRAALRTSPVVPQPSAPVVPTPVQAYAPPPEPLRAPVPVPVVAPPTPVAEPEPALPPLAGYLLPGGAPTTVSMPDYNRILAAEPEPYEFSCELLELDASLREGPSPESVFEESCLAPRLKYFALGITNCPVRLAQPSAILPRPAVFVARPSGLVAEGPDWAAIHADWTRKCEEEAAAEALALHQPEPEPEHPDPAWAGLLRLHPAGPRAPQVAHPAALGVSPFDPDPEVVALPLEPPEMVFQPAESDLLPRKLRARQPAAGSAFGYHAVSPRPTPSLPSLPPGFSTDPAQDLNTAGMQRLDFLHRAEARFLEFGMAESQLATFPARSKAVVPRLRLEPREWPQEWSQAPLPPPPAVAPQPDLVVTAVPPPPAFAAPPAPAAAPADTAAPTDAAEKTRPGSPWRFAAGFLKNGPRDLRLLLLLIPALLALAFHPALPKVKVSAVEATGGVQQNLNAAATGSWSSFKRAVADRAAVALDEDFRQGLDDWISPGGAATEWSFDANGFVRPGNLAIYRPTMGLEDYQVQFLALIDKQALSWVVRAADFENYYVVKLEVLKPGPMTTLGLTRYAVIKGVPQDRRDTPVAINARPDMIYRIHMDVMDENMALMIQGQIVDAWSEPRLKHGGIGFFSARGEESRVRWLQVTHQYDMLGRLCSYLAPYDVSDPARSFEPETNSEGSWKK